MNKRVHRLYNNTTSPTYEEGNNVEGDPKARGRVGSVAWKVGETIYMGFGDGGNDEDLNDIVFVVKGGVRTNNLVTFTPINWHMNYNGTHDTTNQDLFFGENKTPGDTYIQPATNPTRDGYEFMGWATEPMGTPISGSKTGRVISEITPDSRTGVCYFAIWKPINSSPDPEPISWIFACEDLGGTFDYDFNDVVWKVQKVYDGSGNCTSAYVTVLAAGGTLPFTLKYNGTDICTKATAFAETASNDKAVNAGSTTESKTPKRFEVTGIDQNWTVTGNIDKFVVVVENGGNSTPIQAYKKTETLNNKTPQVILLPGEWEWPTESTPIDEAYTNFKTWVTDGTPKPWSEWSQNKVSGKTVTQSQNVQ